jgi:hypothetical protein
MHHCFFFEQKFGFFNLKCEVMNHTKRFFFPPFPRFAKGTTGFLQCCDDEDVNMPHVALPAPKKVTIHATLT